MTSTPIVADSLKMRATAVNAVKTRMSTGDGLAKTIDEVMT